MVCTLLEEKAEVRTKLWTYFNHFSFLLVCSLYKWTMNVEIITHNNPTGIQLDNDIETLFSYLVTLHDVKNKITSRTQTILGNSSSYVRTKIERGWRKYSQDHAQPTKIWISIWKKNNFANFCREKSFVMLISVTSRFV